MSNNPNPTRQDEAYQAFWEDMEDKLLAEFLELHPDIGPVKEWDKYDHRDFEDYVQKCFEAQGPDEDEWRDR